MLSPITEHRSLAPDDLKAEGHVQADRCKLINIDVQREARNAFVVFQCLQQGAHQRLRDTPASRLSYDIDRDDVGVPLFLIDECTNHPDQLAPCLREQQK